MRRVLAMLLVGAAALTGCGGSAGGGEAPPPGQPGASGGAPQRYPDVVSARLVPSGGDRYRLDVTISSPYDTPERYADGWRVMAPGGRVLGRHTLGHDHADEQPFTRAQNDLGLPAGTRSVEVQARDSENGYGGRTATVPVP